uniref:NADP-dependent oxidoreductase domain-containing protein n=1 Tax=Timema bartmani TaxID=61472 RepID=A0A7R9I2E6_9NEOP|nr:unnamed protein product [Timema bartmani]
MELSSCPACKTNSTTNLSRDVCTSPPPTNGALTPIQLVLEAAGQSQPSQGLRDLALNTTSIESTIDAALKAGYRHFDTAYFYRNEAEMGKAFKK